MIAKKYFSFVKSFFFPLLPLGVLFVASSIFWTSDVVFIEKDLSNVHFGFPLKFTQQNLSRISPPEWWFPHIVNFGSILEDPVTVFWALFLLDIAIVQIILSVILFIIHSAFPSTQKFFRFLSVKYTLLCISIFMLVISVASIFYTKWMMPQPGPGMYTPPPARQSSMLPMEIPAKTP